MENKNNFILGAAVALVGSLVGVGAVVSANLLSFQGHNPNVWKNAAPAYERVGSDDRDFRRSRLIEGTEHRGNYRQSVRNAAAKFVSETDCSQYPVRSTRRILCDAHIRDGEPFHPRQTRY